MAEPYIERAHKQIQVESWSNAAREILLRGYSEDGPFAESHTTNADRSRATDTYEVHGDPVSISARPLTVPVRRGECYVRVSLLVEGEPVKRLLAAYLTDGKTLSWPPGVHEDFTEGKGLVRLVTGTDPAAGAEILEAVPANARWRILSLRAVLVADATVLNRSARFVVDNGAAQFYETLHPPNQAASETRVYNAAPGMNQETAFDGSAVLRLNLPPEMYLFQGYRIGSVTGNLQAGDNWGPPRLLVEEWIEE